MVYFGQPLHYHFYECGVCEGACGQRRHDQNGEEADPAANGVLVGIGFYTSSAF